MEQAGRFFVALKSDPHYRRDAFERGLAARGLKKVSCVDDLRSGDIAVFWNLYRHDTERIASSLRGRGCRVLVAENGYAGHDRNGHRLYALAADGHNGSGRWYVGPTDRLSVANVTRPMGWRKTDRHAPFLVCGQRGIGSSVMASPEGWHHRVAHELSGAGVPFLLRPHPGTNEAERGSLDDAILRSRGVIVWSSACGVRALLLGVPVWFAAPHWVCEAGARRYTGPSSLAEPLMDDAARDEALRAMSWAQWTLEEIGSGEAFAVVLSVAT